ncbi:MAG: amidohydrolase [Actinobacteria bacterium]|nr:amidohydrolase [Actinomycetota bacterium]
MSVDLVIRDARYVIMTDDAGGVQQHVSVAIDDGRIVSVGEAAPEATTVLDGRGLLVMPGLVNLHTHLAMTLLRGIAEEVDLQGFLERVWAEEARIMDAHGVYAGTRLGALEAVLGGTTTALDMYFHPADAHRAAVEVGLRHVTGPVFFSFPGPDHLEWEERMALARAWPGTVESLGGPYVPPALMPHAAFTVGLEHLAEIADLAREQGALVHTHASENDRENDDTVKATGMRPVPALEATGVLALSPVLGHGVRLDNHDRDRVAATGTSVAHCPGSNLKLASGAADIVAYRDQGIRVGIGTDGCSSSNDLDMFAAMRLAANLARLVREDPAALSARDVVRAATIEGARALGLGDRIGTVEVGKEADLVALDLRAPHLVPVHDPYTSVVFSAGRSDVRHVLVAGRPVVVDREPVHVDRVEVMTAAADVVESS